MKARYATLPFVAVVLGLGGIALHPGRAYADPSFAKGPETLMQEAKAPETFTIDPMHSGVSFEIGYFGMTRVQGRIGKFEGKIVEAGSDLSKASVEFTAQSNSIDTAVPLRDEHLRGKEYFDAESFPKMTFKSTKVERAGDHYSVTGDLTMKGKTKSITIPFHHFGPKKADMMPGKPTLVGIVGDRITIKRSDFGISNTTPLPDGTVPLSDEVEIRITLEASAAAPEPKS